jgi:hypothetical protein
VKTTKNTERRVQRQVVLEDGRVLEHESPHIVVDTIEDTRTHEVRLAQWDQRPILRSRVTTPVL